MGPRRAVAAALAGYARFGGRATRPEFWWFAVLVALVVVLATTVPGLPALAGWLVVLAALVPLTAAASRRMRDAGYRPARLAAPLGFVALVIILALMASTTTDPYAASPPTAAPPLSPLWYVAVWAISVLIPLLAAAALALAAFWLARPSTPLR